MPSIDKSKNTPKNSPKSEEPTEDALRDIKPGPELDALVAEKVMGLVRCECCDGWRSKPGEGDPVDLPKYSTRIEDAWEVVEKLMGWPKYGFEMGSSFDLNTKEVTWHVNFQEAGDWPKGGPANWGFGDTVPHAICLAALKAVGVLK